MLLTTDLSNGFDEFLFGIPLILLLFFGFFRLDETFARKKKGSDQTPPAPKADPSVYPRQTPQSLDPRRASPLSDPDGRPWEPRLRRKS